MPLRPLSPRSHQPSLLWSLRANPAFNASEVFFPPWLRCRPIHSTPVQRADVAHKNHYERLNVRHDASPADIKKSYFSLSKTHHPDTNRSDPNASHTFSLLSESYKILSDPSRRAAYDRDVLRLHHHPHHPRPHGSYHSSHNPAGGRDPSGLSRRRGTFRGPPPSFYRSGGWGSQAEKRRKAHEESTGTGTGEAGSESTGHANAWASASAHHNPYGGMGPGSDPYHHYHSGSTPHFDRHGHTQTQTREDVRRRRRRAMGGSDDVDLGGQTSTAGHFFIITGILAATLLAPLAYFHILQLGKKKKKKEKD